jgi:hypothetical protein
MKIKGNIVSITLGINKISISTSSGWSNSPLHSLPPPDCSVHLGIKAFRWRIAINVTLRGGNEILGVGWVVL